MKILIDDLGATLVRMAEQLKLARCAAAAQGIATLDFTDEITVTVDLITGVNALERPSLSVAFPSETQTDNPESVQRQEQGLATSRSVASPFEGKSTSTKTELTSEQEEVQPYYMVQTIRESEKSVEKTVSTDTSDTHTGTGTSGKDTRTTENTYE
jgi:hypothetical protein